MKKILMITAAVAIACTSTFAMAASSLHKVKITNKSTNIGASNTAIGVNATANTGSVNIKNSDLNKVKITNKSTNIGTSNTAIGVNSTANMGSVNIQ